MFPAWWLSQRRIMAAVGLFLLSWALSTITPDLPSSRISWEKYNLASLGHTPHTIQCYIIGHKSPFRSFVYTLISLIYFHTSLPPLPMKGKCSKCLMRMCICTCPYKKYITVCVCWIYVNTSGLHISSVSLFFYSAFCFLRGLHIAMCPPRLWLSLLVPWGAPAVHPSPLSVTDTQVASTPCLRK